jgi:hypothetical protein
MCYPTREQEVIQKEREEIMRTVAERRLRRRKEKGKRVVI